MSRTDKDRPYWVILNDKTIEMEYEHWHSVYGRSHFDYSRNYEFHAEYCTAYQVYTRHLLINKHFLLPCRRYPLVNIFGRWKLPRRDRINKHRPHRRDFLKKQVKVFNSNVNLYDDYEFMNDEVFEPFAGENNHNGW